MKLPILMTEEFWANSQFSIVRHTGAVNIDGHRFVIVDKNGRDIFELSLIAEKGGKEKAIEPGEPCDLIQADFIQLYKQYGRDKFIETIRRHLEVSTPKELKRILQEQSHE